MDDREIVVAVLNYVRVLKKHKVKTTRHEYGGYIVTAKEVAELREVKADLKSLVLPLWTCSTCGNQNKNWEFRCSRCGATEGC